MARRLLHPIALLAGFGAAAFAADGDAPPPLSLEELLNTPVLSVSKMAQSGQEAPGVISLIPREQLERYGWTSLNDVLYRQPGFGPDQDYDRRTVGARGLFEGWNNNHLLLLVDGAPVNDNLYGTAYTWEITPLTFAKSVEITRGPGSALYGSNATGGVIQVNTVNPEDLPGGGEARVRAGGNGTRLYDFVAGRAGERVAATVALDWRETDGDGRLSYDGSGRRDANGGLGRFRTSDERANWYGWAKLEGRGPLAGFDLQFHEQSWRFQTGHGWLWWIPDFKEAMSESRRLVSLRYRTPGQARFTQEYLLRHQRHDIDWNQRYYPDDAFLGYYPAGLWEYLRTGAADWFVRGQWSRAFASGAGLLGGVELDRFLYTGDREHDSNVDLDDAANGYPPFPNNAFRPLGPWLDFIKDHPLLNTGLYAQFTSGGLFGREWQLTAGARYDRLAFHYDRIYAPGRPAGSRTFSRVSPRLALVWLAGPALSFKLMGGRAFRAPSPTELAGAHTFSLASNIASLEPEQVTTWEAAASWQISPSLTWRTNIFRTKFENQIAYSVQNNNLSANILTHASAGLESELLYAAGPFSGFFNYAFVKRLDEKILDATIAASPDRLAWEPPHKFNFGVDWSRKAVSVALSGHWQTTVRRRDSEVGVQPLPFGVSSVAPPFDLDPYRGREVKPWLRLDLRAAWRTGDGFELSAVAENLAGTRYQLVKVNAFPFDYEQEGRRLSFEARYRF